MTIKDTALWIFILTGITANLIFQDSLSADADNAAMRQGAAVKEVDTVMDKLVDRKDSKTVVLTERSTLYGTLDE